MRYDKSHLSIDDQVARLTSRGMEGDPLVIAERLSVANYHRLTAYWHPFRLSDHSFAPGTDFETVWRRYVFDRQLRLLVLDAIERFEVALRTQFSFHHSKLFGPFGYYDSPASLPKLGGLKHAELKVEIDHVVQRNAEELYVRHFLHKYGDEHPVPPIWAAVELIDFGKLMQMYQNAPKAIKKPLAEKFGVPDKVLGSWILGLVSARNICAHHGRLWNRTLGVKLMELPADRFPDWHSPHKVDMGSAYGVIRACHYLIRKIAPQSGWTDRVNELLNQYPDIPKSEMGFPDDENCISESR